MKLLVIEDQPTLARNIQRYLQLEDGYIIDVAFDGRSALVKALHEEYDCIICDVMLPEVDGFTVCRKIREKEISTPIIMLTSLTDTEQKIEGLDAGADDYITKPFELRELSARIRAHLRRGTTEVQSHLEWNTIQLDPNKQQVFKDGKTVDLSPKEYALLEFLLRNKGHVKKRIDIISHVWGEWEETLFSKTLDVHIAYLRKKLDKKMITTVSGTGYMIE